MSEELESTVQMTAERVAEAPGLGVDAETRRPRSRIVDRVRAAGWPLPALLALLVLTGLLYLWGLSRSGWANSYYSAAAQAAGVVGRRGSSAPSTRRTSSPWTRRPAPCG